MTSAALQGLAELAVCGMTAAIVATILPFRPIENMLAGGAAGFFMAWLFG